MAKVESAAVQRAVARKGSTNQNQYVPGAVRVLPVCIDRRLNNPTLDLSVAADDVEASVVERSEE
jgi:hypothetical protein